MAKSVDLQMVVGHFYDQLGAQRLPTEVFAATPPALAAGDAAIRGTLTEPGVGTRSTLSVRFEHPDELVSSGGAETGGDSYMVEYPVIIEETEEK
jgi:hypothetical protein